MTAWIKRNITMPCGIPDNVSSRVIAHFIWWPVKAAGQNHKNRALRDAVMKLHNNLQAQNMRLGPLKIPRVWPDLPKEFWTLDVDGGGTKLGMSLKHAGNTPNPAFSAEVVRSKKRGPEAPEEVASDDFLDKLGSELDQKGLAIRGQGQEKSRRDSGIDVTSPERKKARTDSYASGAATDSTGREAQQRKAAVQDPDTDLNPGQGMREEEEGKIIQGHETTGPQKPEQETIKEAMTRVKARLEHLQKCERDLGLMAGFPEAVLELAARSGPGVQADLAEVRRRIPEVQGEVDAHLERIFQLMRTEMMG